MGSTPQLYSLSWGEFSNCLSSTVQSLRGHGDLVDVTLTAGGKIFPAHKLVLGSASPLLMELLKSTKCEHPVVMLAGVNPLDLEALLHFVYTGEVSVDPAQIPSLLQAAQCLDIQALTPSILSLDKSGDTLMGSTDGTSRTLLSSFASVRKKRKKTRSSCAEDVEGDDVHKNSSLKKSPLLSDLPVSCSICGVTLRQSRNLRRHMALIHMKGSSIGYGRGRKGISNQDIPDSNRSLAISDNVNDSQMTVSNNNRSGGLRLNEERIQEARITDSAGLPNNNVTTDSRLSTGIENRVMDARLTDNSLLDSRCGTNNGRLSDPRLEDGRQLASYPASSLCESIPPYLHLDSSFIARQTDIFRHQQT